MCGRQGCQPQENRLVQTRNRLTYTNNFATASADNFYDENYSYDRNGNILTLSRNGSQKPSTTSPHTPMQIDDFKYNYNFDAPINGRLINNRLRGVHEQNALPSPGPDIRRIQGLAYDANTTDYEYDEIGNLIKDNAEGITDIKWNVYGKITDIDFTDPARADLSFEYDATGNRIAKTVKQGQNQLSWITTLYERDASGNVMATYERTYATAPSGYVLETTKLIELPIYGSSRVGLRTETQVANTAEIKIGGYESDGRFVVNSIINQQEHNSDLTASLFTRNYGFKNYELSNHLGNVLATITDWKQPSKGIFASAQTANEYLAQVSSANDYYPFGMPMPGRQFNAGNYRFGFNGKEMDNEVKGQGNSLDFGARIYDSRLGRWLSIDPAFQKYPGISTYCFASNNPIYYVDQNGKWLGVTFIYGEISGGIGVGYGVYYVEQSGLARDDVGKTHFTTRTFLHINNQNLHSGSSNPNLVIGADANILSVNIKQDWSANTYMQSIGVSALDLKIPGGVNMKFQPETPSLKFGAGFSGSISPNSVTAGLGLQAGLTFNIMSNEILESISLTNNESSRVNSMSNLATPSWTMGAPKESRNKNGELTGYTASLMVTSRDNNGNVFQKNTGMTLKSGIKYDEKGNASPNNVWASDKYINEAATIEQNDNK